WSADEYTRGPNGTWRWSFPRSDAVSLPTLVATEHRSCSCGQRVCWRIRCQARTSCEVKDFSNPERNRYDTLRTLTGADGGSLHAIYDGPTRAGEEDASGDRSRRPRSQCQA